MSLNDRRITQSGAFSAPTRRAAAVFRPAALEFAYVGQLQDAHSALLDQKTAAAEHIYLIENTP